MTASHPFRFHAVAAATLLASSILAAPAMAQTFAGGNLIVSRTVYEGTASTVTVGQLLPGGGTKTAIGDGQFANVFKNETPDPSFGVSSPIYIDQMSLSGTRISTLAIDSNQITTSFASKSELALNVSSDGKSVSFMGYNAPKNTLDVSNSNTAAVFDSTNPVGSTYSRAIGTINLNTGAVQVTNVNAYSGNNGRAAVQVNGQYYMVGNAGNGSATGTVLSQLSDNTGVQRIAVGASGNTTAVGAALGTFGSSTGYQHGFSLAQLTDPSTGKPYAADKTGKDDNFRGMTVYNNTLYVTKGSGSNGVDTVYQVGAKGALANGGVLDGTAAITILPGFNKISEKVLESTSPSSATSHPFGIQFLRDGVIALADEGDGVRLGVAGKMETGGLEIWKADSNGNWSMVQNFQQGLVGQQSTPTGLGWIVQQDGLRNITAKDNGDGTYTVIGTTSTVSDELTHDLGADPNEIVSITFNPDTGANTGFTALSTASVGERFGGVTLAPVPEPESYALALVSLAVFGMGLRKQRRHG